MIILTIGVYMSEEYNASQFAASIKVQCYDLMPEEFSEEDKEYVANILYEHTKLAFDALDENDEYEFTYENKIFISQIIAEWTFHKAIDLIKSEIPTEYWDASLQKLAFVAYEIAKSCIIKGTPQGEMLQAIEYHIDKTWNEIIEELYLASAIDLDTKAKALKQSNIDDLAQEAKEKQENNNIVKKLDEIDKKLEEHNQKLDEEIQEDQAEIAKMVSARKGCANAMQFLVFISAAIFTCLFAFLLKICKIDTTILSQIKYFSFYIGVFTCFVFGICTLIQNFQSSFSLKTFGTMNKIFKNVLFYSSCALFSVMSITGFKPLICVVCAITCIKFSAIATVNQIKCKNIN